MRKEKADPISVCAFAIMLAAPVIYLRINEVDATFTTLYIIVACYLFLQGVFGD
jgi:hypothetical protein